jgi:[acyl-carrier-protein] S-malonyltransferase
MERELVTFAMVFPGQGSQSVGMQADLAEAYPAVRSIYDQASERLGFDLWGLVQAGPAEKLGETTITQPAMLTAGIAAYHAWRDAGGQRPDVVAGHSLGEYTALVVAEVIDFASAVDLVALRARLMQEAVAQGEGAMAAILGLDDNAIRTVCESVAKGQVVEAVNFNSPGQVVIAGHRDAVERAAEAARAAGARRAMLLNVSVPSHCALMKPAAASLGAHLAGTDFASPTIPVISNVDVAAYGSSAEICDGLTRQLYSPVRWVETIEEMQRQGASCVIECGPGKVLAGLNRRIAKELPAAAIENPDTMQAALELAAGASNKGD